MEQNHFDGLEEVEVAPVNEVNESKEPKEYEKLLKKEEHRQLLMKAINLVKFGCFEQKTELKIDFSRMERIDSNKKFKGLYTLYRNIDTKQLCFVAALVENKVNDYFEKEETTKDESVSLDATLDDEIKAEEKRREAEAEKDQINSATPYSYDVIYVDLMDDETYKKVMHAGRNNISSMLNVLYIIAFVMLGVALFGALFVFIYDLVKLEGAKFVEKLYTAFVYMAPYLAGITVAVPTLILAKILFDKFKDK